MKNHQFINCYGGVSGEEDKLDVASLRKQLVMKHKMIIPDRNDFIVERKDRESLVPVTMCLHEQMKESDTLRDRIQTLEQKMLRLQARLNLGPQPPKHAVETVVEERHPSVLGNVENKLQVNNQNI